MIDDVLEKSGHTVGRHFEQRRNEVLGFENRFFAGVVFQNGVIVLHLMGLHRRQTGENRERRSDCLVHSGASFCAV
jgi:hypothetical protein